jgi:hypothetical protein
LTEEPNRRASIRYLEDFLMPRYFFDIKDGHSLVDTAGRECKNDTAAKDIAEALAIVVSIDTPAIIPGGLSLSATRPGKRSIRRRFIPNRWQLTAFDYLGRPSAPTIAEVARRRHPNGGGHFCRRFARFSACSADMQTFGVGRCRHRSDTAYAGSRPSSTYRSDRSAHH